MIPDQDRELIMKGVLNSDMVPGELLGTPPPVNEENNEMIDNQETDNEEQVNKLRFGILRLSAHLGCPTPCSQRKC